MIHHFFTDGSCLSYKYAGWSVVIPNVLSWSGKLPSSYSTNNIAELVAIGEVFNFLENNQSYINQSVEIYSDSIYAIKTLTEWAPSWEKRGQLTNKLLAPGIPEWKKSNGKIPENLPLIQYLMKMIHKLKDVGILLQFHHVRAHTKNNDYFSFYNNEADVLARKSATASYEFNVPQWLYQLPRLSI